MLQCIHFKVQEVCREDGLMMDEFAYIKHLHQICKHITLNPACDANLRAGKEVTESQPKLPVVNIQIT